jgi:fatty-acyl-CoA synthase
MKSAAATRGGLSKLGAQAALYDLYGHQLSGHDLLKSVDQLAGALVEQGLIGRKIGLWYRNSFEAVQAFLAVEWIGGTRVTVDPRGAGRRGNGGAHRGWCGCRPDRPRLFVR